MGLAFFRASTKLLATFGVAVVGLLVLFAFAPDALLAIQDVADFTSDQVQRIDIANAQGEFLYRSLVNGTTIFGMLLTILARAIVELVAFAFGRGGEHAPD